MKRPKLRLSSQTPAVRIPACGGGAVPELPPAPALPPVPALGGLVMGTPSPPVVVPAVPPLVPDPVPPVTPLDAGPAEPTSIELPVVDEPDPTEVPSIGAGPMLAPGSCLDPSGAEPHAPSRAKRGIDSPKVIEQARMSEPPAGPWVQRSCHSKNAGFKRKWRFLARVAHCAACAIRRRSSTTVPESGRDPDRQALSR